MIKYPISMRDAMRSYMKRVPAAEVRFVDPQLEVFFADAALGLCTIEFVRPSDLTDPAAVNSVRVTYLDPELEMLRALSC